jgi:opacity protein-like surface antigen
MLVRAGLPPYRVDTKSRGAGAAQGKGNSAADRKVVVRWTKNEAIAEQAVQEEKPAPKEELKKEPKKEEPKEEPKKEQPKPVVQESVKKEDDGSLFDLVPFGGLLLPSGELRDHAKRTSTFGLGIGKAFFTGPAGEFRATLFASAKSKLEAKESDRDGPLHIQVLSLRADYAFGSSWVRPFVGLGLGSYGWDATIKQPSIGLKNTGDKRDTGFLGTLGVDFVVNRHFIPALELSYHKIGGEFDESLMTAVLALRWRI